MQKQILSLIISALISLTQSINTINTNNVVLRLKIGLHLSKHYLLFINWSSEGLGHWYQDVLKNVKKGTIIPKYGDFHFRLKEECNIA